MPQLSDTNLRIFFQTKKQSLKLPSLPSLSAKNTQPDRIALIRKYLHPTNPTFSGRL